MNLLPKTQGNRPRLACEIAAGAVVAGRSPEPGAPLTAVARVALAEGAVVPSLKPGNIPDRVATIAAVRRALEGVGARPNARNADLTLIIPDGAVRVLLLDFDALPSKLTDSLPLVRFRLKKLVPFDTDDAMVSFQVMSSSRGAVRVLAVAIPRDVLSDYETAAREAGFEPGAVLPSTLAALAGLPESEGGLLAVNVYPSAVTTAIVRGGVVLLHRTVELTEGASMKEAGFSGGGGAGRAEELSPAGLPAALFEPSAAMEIPAAPNGVPAGGLLPLVDREETAGEWAAQEPLPEFGRNPYPDAISAEMAVEAADSFTAMPVRGQDEDEDEDEDEGAAIARLPARMASRMPEGVEPSDVARNRGTVPAYGEDSSGKGNRSPAEPATLSRHEAGRHEADEAPVHTLTPEAQAEEIAQAVSVAVAYFEDLLSAPPEVLLSAGPLGADRLGRTLEEQGLAQEFGLHLRELVEPGALAQEATTAAVPRGLLAGVVGALRS